MFKKQLEHQNWKHGCRINELSYYSYSSLLHYLLQFALYAGLYVSDFRYLTIILLV